MATSARSNSRSRTRLERVALAWRRFGSFSAAGRALGLVAPFGFSWLAALSLRRPPLMSLGFSWISLDSLVRIETYQWVTRHKAEKLFSRASCLAFERRWDGSPRSWHVEGQDCAWGELNRGSDFQQEIVVRVGRFGPSQSKSRLVLCKTEVLLAAGRRFADHHPALAQILEMGKGRKASGTRQGWI
jgi:hypothetical protein